MENAGERASDSYDVLIVGARCAGATLATFLRKSGKRVLLIDAGDLPSDQPLSTHFLGPTGMSILDELGLGDRVRAVAPAIRHWNMGFDDVFARLEFAPSDVPRCPRRAELDPILLEAARAAGAELRIRTRLIDVLREGNRVCGAIVEHDGEREQIRAKLVVGADGAHSTVAARVKAEEYNTADGARATFWTYVDRPEWFGADPHLEGGMSMLYLGDSLTYVFPTSNEQLLLIVAVPRARAASWTGDKRERIAECLRLHPRTARLAGCELTKVLAYPKPRYFFRQAAGPGWALVGDAGLFKDPAPGEGIADAFRDARALAAAIDQGTDAALTRYWRERDVKSVEPFSFAEDLSSAGFNSPLRRAAYRLIDRRPDLQSRVMASMRRELSSYAVLPMKEVLGIVFGELLRGRFDVLPPFLAAGKRGKAVAKELAARKALAEEAARA